MSVNVQMRYLILLGDVWKNKQHSIPEPNLFGMDTFFSADVLPLFIITFLVRLVKISHEGDTNSSKLL